MPRGSSPGGPDARRLRRRVRLLGLRDFGTARHDTSFGPDPYGTWELVRAGQDNPVHALRLAPARQDAPTVAAVGAVLGGLWTMECSYVRLITLAEETGPLLSHHRPAPADVAPVRSVLTFSGGGRVKAAENRSPSGRPPWCTARHESTRPGREPAYSRQVSATQPV
ncbi:hypothetical protein ACIQNG_11445 [Streptomyces sp. NPDC091377]|uniref:hypothetical protein n=1 Tax=Streptomyces sp. NPDC091377 TaxID=3365995 RepID=UPI0038225423